MISYVNGSEREMYYRINRRQPKGFHLKKLKKGIKCYERISD